MLADICAAVGCSAPTARKVFAVELAAKGGVDLFEAGATSAPKARQVARKGAGRPASAPDKFQREEVEGYVALGMSDAAISRAVGVSEPTLRKHFAQELALGDARTEARLIRALLKSAFGGNVSAQRDALDRVAQARLDKLVGAAGEQATKPETPGKKAQADLDALAAAKESAWASLLN